MSDWRTLSSTQLESAYNARAAIPNALGLLADFARRSAEWRAARPDAQLDLAYGPEAAERLDFFPAQSVKAAKAPLFIFIHGGYWRSLDKGDFSFIAPPFNRHGVHVASINYGLAPTFSIRNMAAQVAMAIAWLYRQAPQLGVDRERMTVGGHSAGGHLAAMAMAARWPLMGKDLPANLIKGGVAVSGIFELEPLVQAPFIQQDLKLTASEALALSPAYMPPATSAPLITAVGQLESSEFHRQSALLRARWPRQCAKHFNVFARNHLDVCAALAEPDHQLFGAALALARRPAQI